VYNNSQKTKTHITAALFNVDITFGNTIMFQSCSQV